MESFTLSASISLPFRVFLRSFYPQLPGVLVILNRRTRKKYVYSIFPEAGWKVLFKYNQIWFTFLLAMHSGCIFPVAIPTLVFWFIIVILISMKRHLTVICICNSFMTPYIKHLSKCLLDIYIPFLDKGPFKSFAYF